MIELFIGSEMSCAFVLMVARHPMYDANGPHVLHASCGMISFSSGIGIALIRVTLFLSLALAYPGLIEH